MGIVLMDCGNQSDALSRMTCLSTRIWFSIDLLLIIIIVYQICLRIKRTHKKFSRKLIILYLLLIQPLINGIYSSIEYYIELYLLDIYFRHLCFVYLVYFFSRRAWLLGDNPSKFTKNFNKIISIILFLYFTAVSLFGIIYRDAAVLPCKEQYWVFLRIGGICMTILFMAQGIILWKRYKHKLTDIIKDFIDNLKLYSYEDGLLENACPAKDYIAEFNATVIRTDEEVYLLWEIIGYNFFSQILSLFSYLYYLFNNSLPSTCHLYPESYKIHDMGANVIEMLLGSIIKIICFLLPIVIPLKAFWLARQSASKITHESKVSIEDPLKINDSFASHEEEKQFWKSLKFKSKATEKSSSDEFINKNLINNNDIVGHSETEEEKSPISMISILSQNLQKSILKKSKKNHIAQNKEK